MIRKNRPIPGHTAKLLIFDLDGTLIDSREDLANSINAMLIHFGKKELPHEVIASYIGDGAPMLVRRSLGDPDDENFVQDAVLYFMSWYREHKLDNTYVYDGVKEALAAIQKSRNGASPGNAAAQDGRAQQQARRPVSGDRRSAWPWPIFLSGLRRQQLPYQEARSRRRANSAGRSRRGSRKKPSSSATPILTCSPPATPESTPSA